MRALRQYRLLTAALATSFLVACGSAGEATSSDSFAVGEAPSLAFVIENSGNGTVGLRLTAGTVPVNGFTVEWIDWDLWASTGVWPTDQSLICTATFSGAPFTVAAGQSLNFLLGQTGAGISYEQGCEPPVCGEFKIRVTSGGYTSNFVNGWSDDVGACEETEGCTLTQGFWKTHPEAWPVSSITICGTSYSKASLITFLSTPVKGNGIISLGHQYIAAYLNAQSGATASDYLDDAVTFICANGGLGGTASTEAASSLINSLTAYNEGFEDGGPLHCED